MSQLSTWSEEDQKTARQLSMLLEKHASWDVSTKEAVVLYRTLVWVAGLDKKIGDSLVKLGTPIYPDSENKSED